MLLYCETNLPLLFWANLPSGLKGLLKNIRRLLQARTRYSSSTKTAMKTKRTGKGTVERTRGGAWRSSPSCSARAELQGEGGL